MNYPINYPLANLVQKLGFTLTSNIEVVFDASANVYIATSKQVKGLTLESESFYQLTVNVREAVTDLVLLNRNIVCTNLRLFFHFKAGNQVD